MSRSPRGSVASRAGTRGRLRFSGRSLRSLLTPAQWRAVRRTALVLLAAGGALALVGAGLLAGAAVAIHAHLPSVDALYALPSEATRIYAADGQLIASLYKENRDSIPLARVPHGLRRAVIDTEDADFYRHRGISLRGVVRAGVRNVRDRGYAEGGSTITQQLARNLFLTNEKSLTRKIAEMLLAVQIERRLTKDEILERYLNQVYFGQGAYGVETAAEVYFGKPPRDLTLAQSALLAGLIRAPAYYSPYEHPERARARMTEVLQRMADLGDITRQQVTQAKATPLRLAAKTNGGLIGIRAPYFVSYILPGLLSRYGEDLLYKGGLRIYTTLDLGLQAAADGVVRQGIDGALRDRLHAHQGALVALDPRTGAIRAMIGGYDFRESQFNRAWQAHRQPGSAFKPFTYTVATMRGIPPTRLLLDAPIEFPLPGGKVWAPKDYDGQWHGLITARYALENSINVASIRLEMEVGPKAIVDLAHRMGIQSKLEPNLSLTLGSSDVTLLEMASAYGVFAAGGVRSAPFAITKVTDWQGKVLEEHAPDRQIVLSPEVTYVMIDLLKGVIARGTGTAAAIGLPAAGKTGTTDDFRNAWFIGMTPSLVAGVWVGNDDNSSMNHVTGGSVPARIWAAFMKQASLPKEDWSQPEGVVQQNVCGSSGQPASTGCVEPRPETFIRGTEPEGFGPGHGAPPAGAAASSPGAAEATPAGAGAPAPGSAAASPAPASGAAPRPDTPAPAAIPVVLTAPQDGSRVTLPLVVKGSTRPGALIQISALSVAGAFRVQVADVYLRADQAGAFAYRLDPWLKPSGGTLIITATATAGTESTPQTGSATVTVKIQ